MTTSKRKANRVNPKKPQRAFNTPLKVHLLDSKKKIIIKKKMTKGIVFLLSKSKQIFPTLKWEIKQKHVGNFRHMHTKINTIRVTHQCFIKRSILE